MSSGQNGHHANDRHHSVVELAEAKAKIRRWRQEVEEKCEQVAELREELALVKAQLGKVKQENMDLVQVLTSSFVLFCFVLFSLWAADVREAFCVYVD